jgi:hypothetical protein
MASRSFGIGGIIVTGLIAWHLAHAEAENPGTTNRGTDSVTGVVSGVVADAKVLVDEGRSAVGPILTDASGAVEGDPALPVQPQSGPNG